MIYIEIYLYENARVSEVLRLESSMKLLGYKKVSDPKSTEHGIRYRYKKCLSKTTKEDLLILAIWEATITGMPFEN